MTNQRIYDLLLDKFMAATGNLERNPNKCGGETYIKGYMSGLLEGMALINPINDTVCMEQEKA